jgi:hypothetical protein
MKKLLVLTITFTLLLSACGREQEPTMSAEDVQGTAVAAAWTMVAETQAAIPTATPVPPTETASPTPPLPTNTIAPLVASTQALPIGPSLTPVAQSQATADICLDLKHVLPADAAGPTMPLRIVNEHNVTVTISLYLNKTVFGECGYRSYTLKKNGDTVQTMPQGCYSAWAWSQDSSNAFNSSGFGLCGNNSDKWTMVIRGEQIIMLPP